MPPVFLNHSTTCPHFNFFNFVEFLWFLSMWYAHMEIFLSPNCGMGKGEGAEAVIPPWELKDPVLRKSSKVCSKHNNRPCGSFSALLLFGVGEEAGSVVKPSKIFFQIFFTR